MSHPGAVLAVVFLGFAFAGPAWSADLPIKALPDHTPIAAPGWTGLYLGGHLGGLWMTQDAVWNPLPSPADFLAFPVAGRLDASHFVGGVHAGYDWQVAPTWVIGIEGDTSWTRASTSTQGIWNSFPSGAAVSGSLSSLSSTLDTLSSVRGRLGYLVTPNALLYATGGAAWGRFNYQASAFHIAANYFANTSFSQTQTGFVVGGGLEWALSPNWLIRGEYLYYGLGDASTTVVVASNPSFPSGFAWHNTNVQEARLGLSYKFDWNLLAASQYWARN